MVLVASVPSAPMLGGVCALKRHFTQATGVSLCTMPRSDDSFNAIHLRTDSAIMNPISTAGVGRRTRRTRGDFKCLSTVYVAPQASVARIHHRLKGTSRRQDHYPPALLGPPRASIWYDMSYVGPECLVPGFGFVGNWGQPWTKASGNASGFRDSFARTRVTVTGPNACNTVHDKGYGTRSGTMIVKICAPPGTYTVKWAYSVLISTAGGAAGNAVIEIAGGKTINFANPPQPPAKPSGTASTSTTVVVPPGADCTVVATYQPGIAVTGPGTVTTAANISVISVVPAPPALPAPKPPPNPR
jgi:hypothetical protein